MQEIKKRNIRQQEYQITVPVYSYAKKILQRQFGESLSKNHLQYDFFIAAGSLYAPIFQVSTSKLPLNSNNISPIELLEIKIKIPDYIIRLLSLYNKKDIAYSLATMLNKQAKEILRAVVEFNFEKHKKKAQACQEVFDYFEIEEEELAFRKYIETFYTKIYENKNSEM